MSKNKNEISVADDKQAEIWFEKNWKKIFSAIVLLIIVGMSVFFFIDRSGQQKDAAAAELAAAPVEKIAELLEREPAVAGGVVARMRLINALLADKKYEEAGKQLMLVAADESASGVVRARARLDAAACTELNGKSKDAAETYLAISSDYAIEAEFRNEAAFQAGRIFMQINDKRGTAILKTLSEVPADPATGNKFWQTSAAALLVK